MNVAIDSIRIRHVVRECHSMLRSATAMAAFSVAVAQLIELGVRMLSGYVITRRIGPELFGKLATIGCFFPMAELLSRLGLLTASRLHLVRTEGKQQMRQASGTIMVLMLVRGAVLALILVPVTFIVERLYGPEMATTMRFMLPLAILSPLNNSVQFMAMGQAHTGLLFLSKCIASISWLIVGSAILYFGSPQLTPLAVASQAAQLAILPFAMLALRPTLEGFSRHFHQIQMLARSYGIHQYAAQLVDQGVDHLTGIVLPVLTSPTEFGYFSLAVMIGGLVSLLSRSLFETRFRRIASGGTVPGKYVLGNWACLLFSAVSLLVVQSFVVFFIFGPRFAEVARLLPVVILAGVFHGAYQPYLAAVGGWADRRFKYTSFVAGPLALILYPGMILGFGVMGAAWARVIMMAVWFFLIYGFYHFIKPLGPRTQTATTEGNGAP